MIVLYVGGPLAIFILCLIPTIAIVRRLRNGPRPLDDVTPLRHRQLNRLVEHDEVQIWEGGYGRR